MTNHETSFSSSGDWIFLRWCFCGPYRTDLFDGEKEKDNPKAPSSGLSRHPKYEFSFFEVIETPHYTKNTFIADVEEGPVLFSIVLKNFKYGPKQGT
ncbi:hypothetical protein NPIL_321151 [Nephila pilipes]|uniref:Uncharacterized protein n=1 Tax=Nephila pilipes TaxID=299642 RepID=A0A8X6NSH1_NEPPI|nr:hypothetical protein NPIL_122711 [Nephila pilipes]GFT65472.1 hypothetical protein NPIL_321151 [Nephila pilipes]